jgi:hypothetical protein
VWATTSLLVHITVVPALTVSAEGSNAKLVMPTLAWAADGAVVAEGVRVTAAGLVVGGTTLVEPAVMFMGAAPAEYLVEAPLGEQAAIPSPATTANAARRGGVIFGLHVRLVAEALGAIIVVFYRVDRLSDT